MSKPVVAQAVEKAEQQGPTVTQMIGQLVPELKRALPKGMDADRLARIALTAVRKDKNLGQCNPMSFAGALLTSAQLGLEPGVDGEAYLVPYKKECQLIIGYQGYAKLFWQHPLARHLDAQAVYTNDEFDFEYGLEPYLRHKPALGNRGEVYAYYAVASLTRGGSAFVVLTADEVKALRQGRVGTKGDIKDPQRWMERKTAVRQLMKLVPKSPNMARALMADEELGSTLRREQEPNKALDPAPEPDNEVVAGELVEDDATDVEWPEPTQPPEGSES